MPFQPYLNFGGNCRAAFERYHEIFGGEVTILTMADMPGGDVPADQKDLVMHAALMVGDDLLMASDAQPGEFNGVSGMYVNYATENTAEAKRVFDALADGGQVAMPFEPSFFAEGFGLVTDTFGTPWMVVGAQLPPPSS
jgi:PhnB protein